MKRSLIAAALCLMATMAFADHGGANGQAGAGPQNGGRDGGIGGAEIIIGNDGTTYVTRHIAATTSTAASTEVRAISATGATLWTVSRPADGGRFVLSGSYLIDTTENAATTTTAATTTLTALSTATGATAWTLTLDGRVNELRPFTGGTLAVVSTPSATAGALPTRTLVAISNSGTVLWRVTIS